MKRSANPLNTFQTLKQGIYYYSIPALESVGFKKISRLPISIRIMLESLLRNCDEVRVHLADIERLACWNLAAANDFDIPFMVARVILQDFTGVPLLVDLAAMRDAMAEKRLPAERIEPQVPVDLVIDHSVQVDRAGTEDAFAYNLGLEFERNIERYAFLKWGQGAFKTFNLVPPGIGIVHQVNLEHIATVVCQRSYEHGMIAMFDTLVGTDSHTTMVNGLGVLGWGVGGIEAEAAMLGQPYTLQAPEVIGFHLKGYLQPHVTATDLTLRITEILRKERVVGKFVEFFGEGAATLSVADRATIGNMAPEYGATIGFFPSDQKTLDYLLLTGRSQEHIELVKEYLMAQQMFGMPKAGDIDYTRIIELDLCTVAPCVAGPKRPQDRIELPQLKEKFSQLMQAPTTQGGYGKSDVEIAQAIPVEAGSIFSLNTEHTTGGISILDLGRDHSSFSEAEMVTNRPVTEALVDPGYSQDRPSCVQLRCGSVVIAAITSCTNTSNPSVMIGAGLLAKKAVEKGLKIAPTVKSSLAPGSRVVTDYLEKTGLQKYLDILGFNLVAYGCTTCIGNSGPLDQNIEQAIKQNDLVVASVLSGNRNFEARVHGSVKANFLMSPPLVVAFALAGTVLIDFECEPLGIDQNKKPVFLRDIWPSAEEIAAQIAAVIRPDMFRKRYAHISQDNPIWQDIQVTVGIRYSWDEKSTYIQKPPYFDRFELQLPPLSCLKDMRALAVFGDSVTTDHISPAGSFKADTPAGKYLIAQGVQEKEFNSYGSRRGNHQVMMRGTFANIRIRNALAGGKEGGFTKLMPEGKIVSIFEAAEEYAKRKESLIVFAGKDYGMGSSRDWAAKGTALLGVKVVVAGSFERIHRSNLIGMGVLPLEFIDSEGADSLLLQGDELFSIFGAENGFKPKQEVILEIKKAHSKKQIKLRCRLDSPIEVNYYINGGIMPYVLRGLIA